MLKELITDIERLFKMFESRKGSGKSNKKVVVHRVQYMENETFSIYFVKITEATYLIWVGYFYLPVWFSLNNLETKAVTLAIGSIS